MDAQQTVNDFIAAIEAKDIDRATALLAPSVSYENMPMDPIVGREAVAATLHTFLDGAAEVDWPVLRTMTAGTTVINERLDRFKIGSGWLELPVAGVFEVVDGEITLWRDYFDLASYQRQLAALTGQV